MSPYVICVGLALVLTFHVTDGGQICGTCSHIPDPRNCDRVRECGDHEECLVEEYLSSAGYRYYDLGCQSSFSCRAMNGKRNKEHSPSLRANSIPLCSSCCNGTKLCNAISGHCNSQALDLTGKIICYNCDYMNSPDQCDRVIGCPVNEQCYIEQRQSGLTGSRMWTSRCGHGITNCQSSIIPIPVVGKKRSPVDCTSCCSENLCNNKCSFTNGTTSPTTTTPTTSTTQTTTTPTTTAAPLAKPVITFVTRPHNVIKGSIIHLTCRADGNPKPSITWNFYALGDTKPTNVQVGNHGADIYIDGVTDLNYGRYNCKARNSQGMDTRYVDILDPTTTTTPTTTTPTTTRTTTPIPTTTLPLSKPVITVVTRPHGVKKGSFIHLTCKATGNPKPTITWHFYALGDTKPTNVRVGNHGADIYIDGVTDLNYGRYNCKARNSQGSDTRYVDILDPTTTTTPTTTTPTTTQTTTPIPTTTLPLSKPVITVVTRPHGVKKGSFIHLTCKATGNPKPTVTWNFYALGVTKPTNVRVGNHGADIYIDGVTDLNYGHYTCKARNSQGEDTRYVDVLEHGPSGP